MYSAMKSLIIFQSNKFKDRAPKKIKWKCQCWKFFNGIQFDCPATNPEKENNINLINSFKHGLNAIVGNGD